MPQSLLAAQKRERDRILAELVRIKGFMPLLMKPRNGTPWTPQERAELHLQLRAVAHLSPYLAATILPGSFLFLPLLAWWLDRRRHRRDASTPGAGRQAEARATPPAQAMRTETDRVASEAPDVRPGAHRADSVPRTQKFPRSKSPLKTGYFCFPQVCPGADNGIIQPIFIRGTAWNG